MPNSKQAPALLNQALVYLAGNLLSRAVGFLMIPVYTRKLSTADYGLAELLELAIQIVALTIGLGVFGGAMMMRTYHAAEDGGRRVVSTALISALCFNGVIAVAGLLSSSWLSAQWLESRQYAGLLQISFVSMAFSNCVEVGLSYLRVTNRPLWFLSHSVGQLLVSVSVNIWTIVFLGWGIWGIATSKLLVTGIGFILCCVLIGRECGFGWDSRHFHEMWRIGVPLIWSNVSLFVIHFGDRFFLQRFSGLDQVGVYSFAYRFAFLVTFIVGEPFGRAWNATVYEYAKLPDWKPRVRFYGRVLVVGVTFICILLALFSETLVRVLATPAFQRATLIIPIVACAYGLREIGDFFRTLLYVNGRTRWIGVTGVVCALLNCILNIALMPTWGTTGAALATLLTWGVYLVILFQLASTDQNIDFPVLRTVLFVGGCVASTTAVLYLRPPNFLLHTLMNCAAVAVPAIIALRSGYLTRKECRWLLTKWEGAMSKVRTFLGFSDSRRGAH